MHFYSLKCWRKRTVIGGAFPFLRHVILACKILTDGVTGVKLHKVVYVITPHLHTKFQISTLLLCQHIPVDVFFYEKKAPN